MTIYDHVVYWIYIEDNDIFSEGYIGVTSNPKRRWKDHIKESKSLNPKNIHLSRALLRYSVKMTIIFYGTKMACYELENYLRPTRQIGWNIQKGGKIHSDENIKKRSESLKGIPRTEEWRNKLSLAKQGKNNPMYGKSIPCSDIRRLSIIKSKNLLKYESYKNAIIMMNDGISADKVSNLLGIGRNVCFSLKNRKHLFFELFPELI
jgi:hypothetical protein